MSHPAPFVVHLRRNVKWLWVVAGVLLLFHFLNRLIHGGLSIETLNILLAKFHLDSENSVTAWFSSVLLLLVGAGWLVLYFCKYRRQERPDTWRFGLLAVVFVVLSCDESASLHELLIVPVRRGLGVGGLLYYAWIIPATVFLACLAVVVAPLLRRVSATLRWGSIMAGAVFVGGAIGAEMFGGKITAGGGFDSPGYFLVMTIEEVCEITGVLLMLTVMSRDLGVTETSAEAAEASILEPTPHAAR
ncbi:MAG: hypothetical protein AAF710_11250 [Planctomycetota bacterium]